MASEAKADIRVPLVDLQASYQSIKAEVDKEIHRVLDSAYYVGGPDVAAFEKEFAAYIGGKHCVACNSGTDALIMVFAALGIHKGDEVIVQANTFVASILGAGHCGATPVLVDVDPTTMMMNVDKVEAAITPNTKAILPVHLYGMSVDMPKLMGIANKHNLLVVEDAAQCHGALLNEQKLGTFGVASCFSFYPGKNLGAYGDGGGIVTNNDALADKLRYLRNYGQTKKYHHDYPGTNTRLDSLQAAVLRVRLRHLEGWNDKRRAVAKFYNNQLAGVGDLITPTTPDGCKPVWHLYVIRTKKRDELWEYLKTRQVFAQVHYPIPIHELGVYKDTLGKMYAGKLPITTKCAKEILSLPIYPDLTDAQQAHVVAAVKDFFGEQK